MASRADHLRRAIVRPDPARLLGIVTGPLLAIAALVAGAIAPGAAQAISSPLVVMKSTGAVRSSPTDRSTSGAACLMPDPRSVRCAGDRRSLGGMDEHA